MTLTLLDFILLIILFFFAFGGFFFGLIRTLGSLAGAVVGVVVAANYFQPIANWLGGLIGPSENWLRIIAFTLLFIVASRLVALIFWIINKVFNLVKILPFMSFINRLAGLILGLAEGVVVLGVALVFLVKFPFVDSLIGTLEASKIAEWLFGVGTWLLPILPQIFEQAKEIIKF